jgi:multidrug resistance efflux pump
MILFLTLLYVGVLLVLVKLKLLPWNLWTKISPVIWSLLLTVVLFLPLQFYAPSGPVLVLQPTVQIVPVVDGLVSEVAVVPNQRVAEGDLLFRIDPTKYQAQVKRLEADFKLAETRLQQNREVVDRGLGKQVEVDRSQAQVDSLVAQLAAARWDLDHTEVRSPGDGLLANVEALEPGARVVSFPLQSAMGLIRDKRVLGTQIHQIYLRHIRPGQPAEVTFKVLPGQVFTAQVEFVVPANVLGQVAPSGALLTPREAVPVPFFVRLVLDDEDVTNKLPAGAVGTVAIYTGNMSAIYVIRRVMVWMDAWLNFIVPF